MSGTYKYFCWKCTPTRTFLTPEAKARHMRIMHSPDMERIERAEKSRDPDVGARYDSDTHMFRPELDPGETSRLRRIFRRLRGN